MISRLRCVRDRSGSRAAFPGTRTKGWDLRSRQSKESMFTTPTRCDSAPISLQTKMPEDTQCQARMEIQRLESVNICTNTFVISCNKPTKILVLF